MKTHPKITYLLVVSTCLLPDILPAHLAAGDNDSPQRMVGRWRKEPGRAGQYNPYPDGCPPELLARQAQQYARLFDLFIKYEDVILRVTFWNIHDGESWLNNFPWKRDNYPTLFDRHRQPKPVYHAVIQSLTRK